MMMSYFISGLAFGMAYCAPIGAQNLYVIQSQVNLSRLKGYLVALCTIFHDVLLAAVCFWGVGLVVDRYPKIKILILIGGAIFLIKIGASLIVSFRKQAEAEIASNQSQNVSVIKIFLTTGALTWLNPQALIDGTVLLGGFQATLAQNTKGFFFLGVISSSIIWFLGLSTLVRLLNKKGKFKNMRFVNLVCGIALLFFGLKLGTDAFQFLIVYFRSM